MQIINLLKSFLPILRKRIENASLNENSKSKKEDAKEAELNEEATRKANDEKELDKI